MSLDHLDTWNVVLRPAALAALGILLEMQDLGPVLCH